MPEFAEVAQGHRHCPVPGAENLAACPLCPDEATARRFCHAPPPETWCARCWPCDCCYQCMTTPCPDPARCFAECRCAQEEIGGDE